MDSTLQSLNHRPRPAFERVSPPRSIVQTSVFDRWILRLLCGVGLGITGYLAFAALKSGDIAGCGAGPIWNCGHVLTSRWSKLFGLPVSVPAFMLYGVLLFSLANCQPTAPRARCRLAWGAITIGALAAGLTAIWFMGLQAFEIGRWCLYCLLVHACGIALGAAILWKRPLGTRATAKLSAISLMGVGVLIGGQIFTTPPATYKIERFSEDNAKRETTTTAPAATEAPAPQEPDQVEVFEPF